MSISKYINNVSALQYFQILRFSTLIIIGIILVKAGYSTDEIGIYEVFFLLANVLSFFWTMGFKNGLISYYPSLAKEDKEVLFFNLGVLLLLFGLFAGSILYLFEDYLSLLFQSGENIPHLEYIIFYLILSAPGNFTEYVYLLKEKYKSIINYGSLIFLLQLIMMGVGIAMGMEISQLLLLMVIWAAIKFIWFIIVLLKYSKFRISLPLQRIFIVFSLPLIIQMLLGNGMEYVDGFIVNNFFDVSTFAQFRYGARELPLVTILAGALTTAMIPLAVENIDLALKNVRRKITRLMNTLFPISIVLMLLSPVIFPIVYSDEFRISAQVFNIYLLIISSRLLMPQVILFAKHSNNILMLSALIELIINITLSLILLKSYGIHGIAWATVIAYLVNKMILAAYAHFKFKISLKSYLDVNRYVFWFLLLIISYYISTLYH